MTTLLDRCRRYPILLAIPSAVIVIVTLAAVVGSKWYLTGDFAHTEFLVRAIPNHPPLIGVAARVQDQGSTPGPSMAYLLYPFYKLFGSNAFALVAAVNVLHLAAIGGCVVVAKRVGGASIAAFLGLTLGSTAMALAPRFFLEPWNVWVPVFAFALFLVLVWGVVCEHLALLPVAVAVGSHCVQTHISYTVLVTGLLGSAVVWLGWLWWRTDRLSALHPLRWLLVATATLIVSWLPPVIEQLRPGTGNMRKLYHQFTDPGEPFVGVRAALKAMIGRFNLFGPWLVDPQKDPRSTPNYIGFLLFVVLVVTSARWAWKRREHVELALYAVLAAATVLGLISTTRIFGTFFEYVIRWMSPLVAMWIAASLWSCWLTWRPRAVTLADRRAITRGAAIVAVAACVVVAVGVARGVSADIPYERDSIITGALSADLEQSLDPALHYQINEFDPVALGSVAFGLALELERHNLHAGVGPWGTAGVMPFRVVDDEHAEATLWYVATKPTIAAFTALPGAVVRASFDVRTAAEVQRSDQLELELLQALCSAGRQDLRPLLYSRWGDTALAYSPGLPPEVALLLQQYTDLRQPSAVVELPVGVNGYDVAPAVPECAG
ncbi:MAG TPA: hypothetical protein VHN36_06920 [Ilumatobacteraceae bacterium]|nr:hypothetical protein [Ilumatobacteraceae bacterium]